jgi:c-di-GMP-binding flagellar brake protein YcgR
VASFDFMDEQGEPRYRQHRRFGKRGTAALRRALAAPPQIGSLFDLSLGGCLIWLETATVFLLGDLIEVKLQIDDLALRLMATVRYTGEEGRVVGLEFEAMSLQKGQQLTQFVSALQQEMQEQPL